MPSTFREVDVSIAMVFGGQLPYDRAAFEACLRAAVEQDHTPAQVVVVDNRGPAAKLDFVPAGVHGERIRHLPGHYANRAAMYNAALRQVTAEFLLLLSNDQAPIVLKRSAVQTMVMAAVRGQFGATGGQSGATCGPLGGESQISNLKCRADLVSGPSTGPVATRSECFAVPFGAALLPRAMVYADYERVEPGGARTDVHLLDWHEGRVRDTTDFGHAILYRTAALRECGGFNESYQAADLYDLRLRLTEKYKPVHIANRFAGALYSVVAPAKKHSVFDYLLSAKQTQLELERVFTEHLKRTGAYLAPGAYVQAVPYDAAEEKRFAGCLASVVIPVNNRPGFIGRAIESVQAQTQRRVEAIVVVNGGDADPTAAEVRRYMRGGDRYDAAAPPVRLIVVDVNNLGLCLNAGIAAARGKYYVQLDSDDRLKPQAVEKLLTVFDSDPTVGMVVGSYEVWTLDERTGMLKRNEEIPVVTHDEWTAHNGRNNLLRINGAGAPRAAHIQVIRAAGWFGVNDTPHCRNYGEDYDLVLRISERYTIGRVWEPIYEVIRHSGGTDHAIDQTTIDRNDSAKDYLRLEALRRRRKLNHGGTETQR